MSTTQATGRAPLTNSQVQILSTLKESGALSGGDLRACGCRVSADSLGPVDGAKAAETHPASLIGMKLVKVSKGEGDKGQTVWSYSLTATGKKAANAYRFRLNGTERVPSEKLDPVLRKVRSTRTYGIELFTTEDIAEIRKALPKEFHKLSDEDIRTQATSRRKAGVFTDPVDRARRAAKAALANFGPDGTVKAILTPVQVKTLTAIIEG